MAEPGGVQVRNAVCEDRKRDPQSQTREVCEDEEKAKSKSNHEALEAMIRYEAERARDGLLKYLILGSGIP
jgi:hypothetical protein